MAKRRINFNQVDRNDPRFFELDPNNPNTNISAAAFDPTDPTSRGNPVGEKYNQWLQTAKIGDKFDWGKESGDPTQKGLVNEFVGFNQMGTPIIKTNVSEQRADWRGAIEGAGGGFGAQMKALTDTGRSETEARFLLSQYFGADYVAANTSKRTPRLDQVGAMADGTPIYGWDAKGNPVTSPTGVIYSKISSTDAINKFNAGSNPLSTGTANNISGDPATLALIQSLQSQVAALTSTLNKQDATATQARLDKIAADAAEKKEKTENAIAVLTNRFNRYNLGSLVPKIRELAISGATESTITLQLQETEEYKRRFRANQDRINKGLSALEPADYLNLEDDYRQILRAYGLRQFDNDDYVTQFISNDISTTELSNRVATAVQRVQNADPAILTTLRGFYGINDNDLVAYVLDPKQQFQKIERQVAAAEIGAAASLQGLSTGVAVAEQLAAQGITKAQAQKGYATIADILPTAEKLSDIYGGTLDEYRQNEAEQEVFNTLASAQRKRQKLAEREAASFMGTSALGKSSLTRQIGGTI